MTIQPQLDIVKTALTQPLLGWAAQKRLAPAHRVNQNRSLFIREDHRDSGVLMLLYPNEQDQLHFILIRRPVYNGAHSGQLAFPGGRREADESLETTALRETNEEIGVPPEEITVLGELSPLYIPVSNYLVYPFVGYYPAYPVCRANPREVAEILYPSLDSLLDPSIIHVEQREFPEVGWMDVPFYKILGQTVWGATDMILTEFIDLFRQVHEKENNQTNHDQHSSHRNIL
jgi:8-oxo-dGTP pyrophosphatase MutT (NUDIX family)